MNIGGQEIQLIAWIIAVFALPGAIVLAITFVPLRHAVIRQIAYAGSGMLALGLAGFELFFGSAQESISGRSGELAILGLLIALPASVVLFERNDRRCLVGFSVVAFAVLSQIVLFTVGGRGMVAWATSPDGTEMCVIETPGGETHQTGFYYRRPGQRWGWFYYEHEDSHWWMGRIRMSPDGTQAVLYRLLLPVAYFDISTERFTIVRWGRAVSPAQRWMPESWTPKDAFDGPDPSGMPTQGGAPDSTSPALGNEPAPGS